MKYGRSTTAILTVKDVMGVQQKKSKFTIPRNVQHVIIKMNSLPSLDVIRYFLLRRDYFQELMGVEEAVGNFEKVADITELKGDLLLEVDMRGKSRKYELAIR